MFYKGSYVHNKIIQKPVGILNLQWWHREHSPNLGALENFFIVCHDEIMKIYKSNIESKMDFCRICATMKVVLICHRSSLEHNKNVILDAHFLPFLLS